MVGIYSHETYTLEKFKINPTDAHLTYLPNEAKIIGKEERPQVGEYLTEKVNSWGFLPAEMPDNVFILKEKIDVIPSIIINIDNFVSAMSELKTIKKFALIVLRNNTD